MTTIERTGIGLHSGQQTTVRITPTEQGKGRYFIRTDLPNNPQIPATVEAVDQTLLSTELKANGATLRTVEHLLASLATCGVNDAQIEVDGAEIPLLDGSAKLWIEAIQEMKAEESGLSLGTAIASPIWIYEGDSFVAALPSPDTRFTYGIDFAYAPIGNQWYSWSPEQESFGDAIAPARTFGLADQIEQLQQAGLIKGGSLENALVCDRKKWLNPPLRFANEPVRHKILDLVGDLSLLGTIPQGHYLAYKASHKLHVKLAKALRERLS
ncbi:MAG: UDP-3-O-acyl-N-acetylglucosamine deacetylase [Microcystaceae cyanobacterium]